MLRHVVLQGAQSEVTNTLKMMVFVDDITAFMKGRNKELVEMAEKILDKLNMDVEEKGLKFSIN